MTDAKGNETTFEYDEAGRQILMTDEFGTTEARTYDADGRLASILNRNGLLTTFAYNEDGQLITKTWYDGATDTDDVVDTFEWTYTPAGQIASASNAAGEKSELP